MTLPPLSPVFVAVALPARDCETLHTWATAYGRTCTEAEQAACIKIIADCARYVDGFAIAIEAIKARETT